MVLSLPSDHALPVARVIMTNIFMNLHKDANISPEVYQGELVRHNPRTSLAMECLSQHETKTTSNYKTQKFWQDFVTYLYHKCLSECTMCKVQDLVICHRYSTRPVEQHITGNFASKLG